MGCFLNLLFLLILISSFGCTRQNGTESVSFPSSEAFGGVESTTSKQPAEVSFSDLVPLPSPPSPPFTIESKATPWFTASKNLVGDFILSPDHQHYAYWKKKGDEFVLCINGVDTPKIPPAMFPFEQYAPGAIAKESGSFRGGTVNRSHRPQRNYNANFRFEVVKDTYNREDPYTLIYPVFSDDCQRVAAIVKVSPEFQVNDEDQSKGIYVAALIFDDECKQIAEIPFVLGSAQKKNAKPDDYFFKLEINDFAAHSSLESWFWACGWRRAIYSQRLSDKGPIEKYSSDVFEADFGDGRIDDFWFLPDVNAVPMASGIWDETGANPHLFDRNLFDLTGLNMQEPAGERFAQQALVKDFPQPGDLTFSQYRELRKQDSVRLVAGELNTDWYKGILRTDLSVDKQTLYWAAQDGNIVTVGAITREGVTTLKDEYESFSGFFLPDPNGSKQAYFIASADNRGKPVRWIFDSTGRRVWHWPPPVSHEVDVSGRFIHNPGQREALPHGFANCKLADENTLLAFDEKGDTAILISEDSVFVIKRLLKKEPVRITDELLATLKGKRILEKDGKYFATSELLTEDQVFKERQAGYASVLSEVYLEALGAYDGIEWWAIPLELDKTQNTSSQVHALLEDSAPVRWTENGFEITAISPDDMSISRVKTTIGMNR